jgi:cell division protein FtsW
MNSIDRQPVHSEPDRAMDGRLLIIIIVLVAVGIAMVFSASYPRAKLWPGHDSLRYLKRQILAAVIGFVALYAMSRVRLETLRRYTKVLYALAFVCLVVVLIIGLRVNGSRAWLRVGPFNFQPSEMAKVVLVIVLARYFAACGPRLRQWRALLPPLAAMAAMVGMIALADMGTALVLAVTLLAFFHLAGARLSHLVAACGAGMVAVIPMILAEPYRIQRFLAFLHLTQTTETSGYQTVRSLLALGSGGLFGVGFGQSREKFFYLPAASTDAILAVFGEELGFLACAGLLFLFVWLASRGLSIARNAPDEFTGLVAGGLTLLLTLQAFVNIAVVTGSIPATGVPLPFVSYGGSSLIFSLAAAGLILNISRSALRKEAAPQLGTAPVHVVGR